MVVVAVEEEPIGEIPGRAGADPRPVGGESRRRVPALPAYRLGPAPCRLRERALTSPDAAAVAASSPSAADAAAPLRAAARLGSGREGRERGGSLRRSPRPAGRPVADTTGSALERIRARHISMASI